LTPLIYLAAFTRGFSPASMVWDIPDSTMLTGRPDDSSLDNYYGPVRLRTALANDYLGPASQLLARLGSESAVRTSEQLGLSRDPNRFSSASDSGQVSLLDITHLYAALANQGTTAGQAVATSSGESTIEPVAVLRVERADGQVLLEWTTSQSRPLVSAQLAYLVNNVLSDEAARWPSLGHPNSLEIGRPAAVKMGRTQLSQDGWTVGYTPRMVVGVWLGMLMDETDSQLAESSAAIWHAIMQFASQDMPAEGWPAPPGITTVNVCDPSGLLPTDLCPSIVPEVFQDSSAPNYMDTLYREFQINRETGRLATVFTPPEVVEERVYLVVPPEAVDWASQAGFDIAPDTYDVIFTPVQNPEVYISQPALFDQVRGQVTFRGSASGEGFEYYRLQVGQGLNPSSWMQIGENMTEAVENGILGVWDASQMSGLYAVELLVVREDQRFERAITQVTVDNQPPQVSILSPQADETVVNGSENTLVFHAQASDDLNLARVAFYLDDKLIGTLTQGPFSLAWKVRQGDHTVRVQAFDLAGNTSEARINFSLK
jgi:membrane carboxypeptidase/penicillin-binding protein PbpC